MSKGKILSGKKKMYAVVAEEGKIVAQFLSAAKADAYAQERPGKNYVAELEAFDFEEEFEEEDLT